MPAKDLPFVSCIMPTRDRRRFVPFALACFRRQNYPYRELIVVDDGEDPVSELVAGDGRIRYVRLGRRASVGLKRNFACDLARGDVIVHWDDDDWSAADRLRRQVDALCRTDADVCGANRLRYFDLSTRQAWEYVYPPDQRAWLAGGTMAYRREFWQHNRFEDLDVGEDAYFVWRAPPERIVAMPDHLFYLATIHPSNVSPKATGTAYWHPCAVEDVEQQLGRDFEALTELSGRSSRQPSTNGLAVRNVYACLVHESEECVIDVVRNLHHTDPSSTILLYDGSPRADVLSSAFPFERYGAVSYPHPRPMRWGWLHEYAIDAMRFAVDELEAETLTIVDSDQLAVRSGYTSFLAGFLAANPAVGMLTSSDEIQPPTTRIGPAAQAWREFERWKPLLDRFPFGEAQFVRWTFWPSSVFTAAAMRDLVELFDHDPDLRRLLDGSSMWATEEVLFPTLVALLGYRIAVNPCSNEFVRFRTPCSTYELERALATPDAFWIHPVARQYSDPIRTQIREHLRYEVDGRPCHPEGSPRPEGSRVEAEILRPAGSAQDDRSTGVGAQRGLPLTLPILDRMRSVDGWLDEDEADALLAAAVRAIAANSEARIVEIGSYCGRGTVVLASAVQAVSKRARVCAIDPHDGQLGARDQGLVRVAPSYERLCTNLARFSLTEHVDVIQAAARDVHWSADDTIDLLVVDGLHDYASVAEDFGLFAPHVRTGGLIVFHDYAAYFPGVQIFVDDLRRSGAYRLIALVRSLAVLEKLGCP